MHMTGQFFNCPNCGAPIQADACPYCGTVFLDWASFEMNRPTYVKVEHQGQVLMLQVIPNTVRLEMGTDQAILYEDSRVISRAAQCHYDLNAEFSCIPWIDPATGKEVYARAIAGIRRAEHDQA